MSEISVIAEEMSFDFMLRKPGLFESVTTGRDNSSDVFRALNRVSFRVLPGDRIGVIGRNGAGKSTLLKLIAGILRPTAGELKVSGSACPLLDLNADIISQATCLQNIRLRALMKGLSGAAVGDYIEKVRAVADIDRFLYSPVSALSTGMKTRFSVALIGDLDPDILIMDEWIGTTDKSFTNKKESLLNKLIDRSAIFFLATHNRALIRSHCNKIMVINNGEVAFFGEVGPGYKNFDSILDA